MKFWKSGIMMLTMMLAVFVFPYSAQATLGIISLIDDTGFVINPGETHNESVLIVRTDTTTVQVISVQFVGACIPCLHGASTLTFAIGEISKQYNFTVTNESLAIGSYESYVQFIEPLNSYTGSGNVGITVSSGVSKVVRFSVSIGSTPPPAPPAPPAPPVTVGGGGGRTTLPKIKAEPATLPVIIVPDIKPTLPVIIVPDIEPTEPVHPLTTILWRPPQKPTIKSRSITFLQYFSGTCDATCDVNDDGFVDFADVVTEYVILQNKSLPKATGTPPILAGAPNIKEGVRLYLQEGKLTGKYDFTLASVPTVIDDTVTFYVMVDTGPTGIIAVESFIQFDPTVLSFIDMDSVGSIFQSTFLANDQIESGVLRLAGVTNTPFIGTNGYIAALRFKPLREGSASLTIINASVYQYEHENPEAIILQGIDGIFSLPHKKDNILTVVKDEERNNCGCLLPNNRLLCLLLFMVTFGAVLSAVLLIIKYQKKEK